MSQGQSKLLQFVRVAGVLAWILLGGYLVFNRQFAKLGFPPLYVGEMVLAVAGVVGLVRFRETFIAPLFRSWPHRLIAAFVVYGAARVLIDMRTYGLDAARDGIICLYGLAAFVLPAVLGRGGDGATAGGRVARFLLPASAAAALWAAALHYRWVDPRNLEETKADLLTTAAMIAAWTWGVFAARSVNGAVADRDRRTRHGAFALLAVGAMVTALALSYVLPTRAIWIAPVVLAALTGVALAATPKRQAIAAAVGIVALGAGAWMFPWSSLNAVKRLEAAYELDRRLNATADQFASHPGLIPTVPVVVSLMREGETAAEQDAASEKWRSLIEPDEGKFQTVQGRQGAHSVRWRIIFWTRAVNVAIHQAPLTGLGFGHNLTNLLRNTPAWPIYEPSQRLSPPNRHPHSAHVTVFARLGFIGLLIWIGIGGAVLAAGIAGCWIELRRDVPAFFDRLTVLGVWVIYGVAMTFGVVLENPFGGIWFWMLAGVIVWPKAKSGSVVTG